MVITTSVVYLSESEHSHRITSDSIHRVLSAGDRKKLRLWSELGKELTVFVSQSFKTNIHQN